MKTYQLRRKLSQLSLCQWSEKVRMRSQISVLPLLSVHTITSSMRADWRKPMQQRSPRTMLRQQTRSWRRLRTKSLKWVQALPSSTRTKQNGSRRLTRHRLKPTTGSRLRKLATRYLHSVLQNSRSANVSRSSRHRLMKPPIVRKWHARKPSKPHLVPTMFLLPFVISGSMLQRLRAHRTRLSFLTARK